MTTKSDFTKFFCSLLLLATPATMLAAGQELVFFNSPCECNGNHAEYEGREFQISMTCVHEL
jgi:hypothetical protein